MLNHMEIGHVTDITPPVNTLTGEASLTMELGDAYIDAGATALDDTDGDLTASISVDTTDVNTDVAGSYNVV